MNRPTRSDDGRVERTNTMKYKKTSKMASISCNVPMERQTIELHVYTDEFDREWVCVRMCWVPLESYDIDTHYSVQRYYL